ncbi:delta(3,5)-Delta(2,4)-dienoyl-CoA isomerase, mitochondrial [Microcaecilia unicolor]|uniref:Delta(3,5)-Delta(2,4)-dienoyl-CoA isomerase, mitochondrial n=1 Tax=Microcaecilia unicolor TaxID=1415580 RepID=A0A6P7ZCF6_9AMPH|nr:delta(3,5)-Delta(2,4)-dienoyl-CoA isomerase, mitochondrial [Microcaecilia unicolor]
MSLLRRVLQKHQSIPSLLGLQLRMMASDAEKGSSSYAYSTLKVSQASDKVLHVELNRPEKLNAMNLALWREMVECFNEIAGDSECNAVVLSGAGKAFTAGIDLMELGGALLQPPGDDVARRAWNLRKNIVGAQESFTVIEKCSKPVIAAIHGPCIGAGVDMISACDIRYCTQDAWFQVKEVDMGLAADVGTLQRLPKIIGNQSLVNELCFTSRKMMSDEAKNCGLVGRVFPDKESMLQGAFDLASDIASKSPVAVQSTKINLVYSRNHSVSESLQYVATWNMSMLQTDDILKSVQAAMEKKKTKDVTFSKL